MKYEGTGFYKVYSDIYIDIIKRGEDEYIKLDIYDRHNTKIEIPNLLAVKKLRDKLTELINKNPEYYKIVKN